MSWPDGEEADPHVYAEFGWWNNWPVDSIGSFLDGERQGEWTFWHLDGATRARGSFDKGRMTGTWEAWTDDGSIDEAVAGTYIEGLRAP